MSLDTLANVKARLGVTGTADDTLLGLLMDSADEWVEQFTGRDFTGGTFTEYFPGSVATLILANFPVTAVTSVKVDPAGAFGSDTAIAATTYALHAERGVIQSKVGLFVADREGEYPRAIQVIYSTATSSVPNDVKLAYSQLVGLWYRRVKTDVSTAFQNLDSQRLGDLAVTFRADEATTDVERLLAPYRTPQI